jgi:HEAT repeat protein
VKAGSSRFLRIRPGEGRTVGLVVGQMFVASAGLTIGESGVNALFFDRVGTHALPVIYLAQGVTGLLAMLVLSGSLTRFERRRAYVVMPVLTATVVVVERVILASGARWIYAVLWLTVAVAWLLQSVFLWGTAGQVTDTRRAKRLFPLFGSAAILGTVLGGVLTRPLAGALGVGNLLFVWAACLGGTAALCAWALGVHDLARPARRTPRRRRPSTLREMAVAMSFIRRSPLLVWMAVAGVLFSVLFYSLYLPFAQTATNHFPDPKQLAGFLGLFGAAVTAIAFAVSMLLTNRLLAWFGAATMIFVLSALYVGSFGILLVSSSFVTLVGVRACVNAWLQGVTSPAWETLVNVVPETRRDQVRAFLSGGPSQTGTAIAGLLALVGEHVLSAKQFALIGLAVSVIAIVVALRIRRSYTGALVDALVAGRPSVFEGRAVEGTAVVLEQDAQAVALALDASDDPDPRVRRLAVEMLASGARDGRVGVELASRARDEDPIVRAHAIRGLGRAGLLDDSSFDLALEDEEPVVRLSAIESVGGGSIDAGTAARLRRLERDPDPSVVAAAYVGQLDGPSHRGAAEDLHRLLASDDIDVRLAAVRRLRSAPPDDVLAFVRPMLDDPSPLVQSQALRTLGASDPDVAVLLAVESLEAGDGLVREAAFEVLGGAELLGYEATLLRLAQTRTSRARNDRELAGSIPPGDERSELLRAALMERARSHGLVALSALALASRDREAMHVALDNLRGSDPGQIANALETIEATEHRSLAGPLLSLWEQTHVTPRDDWMDVVSRDPDPLIRSCVDLVRATDRRGDDMTRSRTSMSPMERVLALRTIPLFAELSTADLRKAADIAEERSFAAGDLISSEGEIGDELHLVLSGTVGVMRGDEGSAPIARRGPGEVVGEMSIITHHPRVASLVAEDDVRTLRIGRREFESMIRERPDVSLAVMRVLAERLSAETTDRFGAS